MSEYIYDSMVYDEPHDEGMRVHGRVFEWISAMRRAGYDSSLAAELPSVRLSHAERRQVEMDVRFLDLEHVETVVDGIGSYPPCFIRTFGDRRPRMLFCAGNVALLERSGIMICGARDASQQGLSLAYRCGRLLGTVGKMVISGYARGIDLESHRGALEAGGDTMAILPYGLARFSLRRALRPTVEDCNFLALSEYPPHCGFSAKSAFRRNRLMVAMADAVIVVEPGDSGGTWFSARAASELGKPLFFMEGGRSDFIPELERLGASRIHLRNGAPVLDEVCHAIGD